MSFDPLLPPWVVLLAAGGLLAFLLARRHAVSALPGAAHVLLLVCLGFVALGPGHTTSVGAPPNVVVLLDTSLSMAAEGRFERARELLHAVDFAEKRLDLRLHTFAERATPIDPVRLPELTPAGATTRIGEAIQRTLSNFEDLLAIVCLSDGANHGQEDPLAWARRAAERRVPIHVLPLGRGERIPDGVLVTPLRRRIAGAPGASVTLPVMVNVSGPAPSRAVVEVTEGTRRVAAAEVLLENGRGETTFTLTVPDVPPAGAKRVVAWRLALAALPQEQRVENNECWVVADVGEARETVLLLEGRPRWEGTFLMRAVRNDPRLRLKAARLLAPGSPVLYGLDAPESEPALPLTAAVASDASIFVLGNGWEDLLPPAALTGRPDARYLLLAGAALADRSVTWGDRVWGRIELTDAGRSFWRLLDLDGVNAEGRTGRMPNAEPLVRLRTASGSAVPVVLLSPDRRVLLFGLSGLPWVGPSGAGFFTGVLEDILGAVPAATLRTAHLNYDMGDQVVVEGPANASVAVIGPASRGGPAPQLALDSRGRGSLLPAAPGLYRLRLDDGTETAFSVAERRAELVVTQPNPRLLEAIAARSGGTVLDSDPQHIAGVLASLSAAGAKRRVQHVRYLWDGPLPFLALAALVFVLWYLGGRRRDA